ncbi:iron complex transport system ATP-binding protein [Halopolyspora algeriensis]|uniref:Iron complex transport system ATP-binding protein n=1 Tax=Halopolyspora algeriensis TaxID=1500506 RepID=A0A368VVK6_9ACTN|nr:ABC transporter ATP-binding protein [Halopolyspora algeriensis]RCW45233.1 iron complex transport system ATP-binding protein [Halopolyspora algeriensis]TQM53048.1 iron complex transport system ATP-binding protein [Halopolyspora algeriensis]
MSLRAENVSWRAGGRMIVDGISLEPRPGSTIGLLGPNGSGKSTLLRLLAGVCATSSGVVSLDGTPLEKLSRTAIARRVAVVEQHATTEIDMSVLDVVRLGRIPHRRAWSAPSAADDSAVRAAIEYTRLEDKVAQSWHTLSGGERQRVQIARALAQEPRELLLDEPTNHLDIQHQLELLALVTRIPVTSVIALHDLNLAAMFCDHLVVLEEGRAVAAGTPARILTEELIAEVYNVRAIVTPDGPDGRPSVRFLPHEHSPGHTAALRS